MSSAGAQSLAGNHAASEVVSAAETPPSSQWPNPWASARRWVLEAEEASTADSEDEAAASIAASVMALVDVVVSQGAVSVEAEAA